MSNLHPPKPGRWALLSIVMLTMPLVGGGAATPVLSVAVGHWLVECDELAIIAEKWMRFQQRPPPPTSDAGHVNVVVSVDHYEREGFEAERADNRLSLQDNHGDGKYFPEIPQFRGVSMLLGWMHEQFTAAEKVFAEHGSTG